MSDVEILAKKNDEVTRLKLIQSGLIIFILLLLSTLVFILIVARFQEPSPTPQVRVIERELFEGKYGLKVPDTITVGELFTYEAKGKKLVNNDAEVRLQTVCTVNGAQNIQTISTFFSNGVRGAFHIKRTTSVPVSTKAVASDDCYLESISSFTFYQVDSNGLSRSFVVTETGKSNKFKLLAPQEEVSTTQSIPQPPVASAPIVPQISRPAEPVQNVPVEQPNQPEKGLLKRIPVVNGLLEVLGL